MRRSLGTVAALAAALLGGTTLDVAVFDEAERLPDEWKPCAHAPPKLDPQDFPIVLAAVGVLAGCAILAFALRVRSPRRAAIVGVVAGLVAAAASALAQGIMYHWKAAGSGIVLAFALELAALGFAFGALAFVVARAREPDDVARVAGLWAALVGAASGFLAAETLSLSACLASLALGAALALRSPARRRLVALAMALAAVGLGARLVLARMHAPEVLVILPYRASSLAADESHLYFGDEQGTLIARAPKNGGPFAVIAPTPRRVSNVAFDDASAYWTTEEGEIMKVAKTGGEPRAILRSALPLGNVAVDADFVYFIRGANAERAELGRVAKDGGAAATLGPVLGCLSLALLDHDVYEYGGECAALSRISRDGGPLSALVVHDPDMISSLAADAANVYFTEWRAGGRAALVKLSKAGGTPEILADDLADPRGLAVSANRLYWTENGYKRGRGARDETCWTGRVMTASASDGSGKHAIEREQPAGPLLVEDRFVYWISFDEAGGKSSIRRVKK